MRFAWHEAKNRRNLAKHRVSFETAALVFDDPHAISRRERIVETAVEIEERWQTLGKIGGEVIVLVAHLWLEGEDSDEEVIRIISARKATPRERQCYEERSFDEKA